MSYKFTKEGAEKFRALLAKPNPVAAETIRRAKAMRAMLHLGMHIDVEERTDLQLTKDLKCPVCGRTVNGRLLAIQEQMGHYMVVVVNDVPVYNGLCKKCNYSWSVFVD